MFECAYLKNLEVIFAFNNPILGEDYELFQAVSDSYRLKPILFLQFHFAGSTYISLVHSRKFGTQYAQAGQTSTVFSWRSTPRPPNPNLVPPETTMSGKDLNHAKGEDAVALQALLKERTYFDNLSGRPR